MFSAKSTNTKIKLMNSLPLKFFVCILCIAASASYNTWKQAGSYLYESN